MSNRGLAEKLEVPGVSFQSLPAMVTSKSALSTGMLDIVHPGASPVVRAAVVEEVEVVLEVLEVVLVLVTAKACVVRAAVVEDVLLVELVLEVEVVGMVEPLATLSVTLSTANPVLQQMSNSIPTVMLRPTAA